MGFNICLKVGPRGFYLRRKRVCFSVGEKWDLKFFRFKKIFYISNVSVDATKEIVDF